MIWAAVYSTALREETNNPASSSDVLVNIRTAAETASKVVNGMRMVIQNTHNNPMFTEMMNGEG